MKLFFSVSLFFLAFLSPAQVSESYFWKKDTLKARLAQNDSTTDVEFHILHLLELASFYVLQDWNTCVYYQERALNLARHNQDKILEARVLVSYASKLAIHNDFPGSLRCYSEALRLCQQHKRTPELSGWLELNIGNLFYRLRTYSKANELYYDALRYFKADNRSDGKAVAYNNLGLCALKLGRPSTALSYFEEARIIRLQLGDSVLVAHNDLYIARAYERLQQFAKADSLLVAAKELFRKADRYDFFYQAVLEQSKLEKEQGNYIKALQLLNQDYGSINDSVYADFSIEKYLLTSELKVLTGQLKEAEELIERGIKEAREHHQLLQARDLYEALMKVCYQQNNYAKALDVSLGIIQLQDSIEESRNKALFEILRTQNELAQQESENHQLEEINKESQAELKERNVLLLVAIVVISLMLILLLLVFIQSQHIKRAEKRLRDASQRIMAIVNNTNNIILSTNAQGKVRLINKAGQNFYQHILGRQVNIGDNFLNLLIEEKHQKLWSRLIQKGSKGKEWHEESKVIIENETRYLFKSFSPIVNEKNEYKGLVMVGADFTDNRKNSLELEKQKEELDQANIAKERMLSILAHDLKDSIFSAKSLTELVIDNSEEHTRENLLEYMGLLNSNFSKTKNLLIGLLDWVKTQSRGMKAQPKEFDIYHLSCEVSEGLTLKVKEKNLEMVNLIPPNTMVMADEEMIRTVLRNLLGNAIKYTFSNRGIITLKAEESGDYIRIHICDNGQGISHDDQLRLFEVPGRISTPGTANEKGTGFGLILCYELLKLHRSELKINSIEGKGSDFYFDLHKA